METALIETHSQLLNPLMVKDLQITFDINDRSAILLIMNNTIKIQLDPLHALRARKDGSNPLILAVSDSGLFSCIFIKNDEFIHGYTTRGKGFYFKLPLVVREWLQCYRRGVYHFTLSSISFHVKLNGSRVTPAEAKANEAKRAAAKLRMQANRGW